MGKPKTINSFFKKKDVSHFNTAAAPDSEVNTPLDRPLATDLNAPVTDERPSKYPRIQPQEMDATSLEYDPRLCPQIWKFPVNLQDEIRRAYLRIGPYQPQCSEYIATGPENHHRRFQASWYLKHSTWLEYSPKKNAIYLSSMLHFC
jgi:hypothetical protein